MLSVKVEDNGYGIPCESFNALGTRHATSKMHTLKDLTTGVHTLGFR